MAKHIITTEQIQNIARYCIGISNVAPIINDLNALPEFVEPKTMPTNEVAEESVEEDN